MDRNKLIAIGVFLLSVATIGISLYFYQHLKTLQGYGLLGIFLINLIGNATIFLPSVAIVSVGIGGTLYNPILVGLSSGLGSAIGECTGYLFGFSSKELIGVRKKHKILYKVFIREFHKYGGLLILVVSFIPNPFIDGLGIIAGASGYPLWKFFIYILIGRTIRNILIALFGGSFHG